MVSIESFDLVVIGSGPAGEKGAAQAAYFGKTVALVEKETALGGAAANTGTLPSKTLRETSLYLSGFLQRGLYGVQATLKDKVTVRDFMYRERLITDFERKRISANLDRHHVRVFQGRACFEDPHTIRVSSDRSRGTRIRGEKILIATGSTPYHPPQFPFGKPDIYDSDTILDLHNIPKSMLIVGGGVIGCEYACMFSVIGVNVTLVEGREKLLPFLDDEISKTLTERMRVEGIQLLLSDAVESVAWDGCSTVSFKSGTTLRPETLLVTSGRTGNTAGLGLEKIGIQPNKRGYLEVNSNYQTTIPHIYAAGDVIGFPSLASTSMEQGRVAMVHAFDLKYKTRLAPILPYGIYTIPECSAAGETEESLTEKKIPYLAGTASYPFNARGLIIGEKDGFVKLLFHAETMKLLGVHIIGELATEIIHTGVMALMTGAGADLFIQTCFNYPTLSEMYKYATYDALGKKRLGIKSGGDFTDTRPSP